MVYTPGDYDRNHLLLQWGGVLPGGESWSCSVKLSDGRTGSPAAVVDAFLATVDTQELLDGPIGDAVLAYHTDGRTMISTRAKLQFAKLNLINRQGHYDSELTSERIFPDTGGAGGIAVDMPNQVALVVSLLTPVNRGPAHRGRFYLPMPSIAPEGGTGLISTGAADSVAASTSDFLEAISDFPGIDLPSSPGAVVMSRKQGAPKTRIVTGVDVGRVLDTQRRRRRNQSENYRHAEVDQGLA